MWHDEDPLLYLTCVQALRASTTLLVAVSLLMASQSDRIRLTTHLDGKDTFVLKKLPAVKGEVTTGVTIILIFRHVRTTT